MYFNPNVWGTVSDWFMVGITTITAYYLYRTLKSQQEVQTTQNKLFEIETVRFRESIKPNLKYIISKDFITPENKENSRIYTIEIWNETYNQALEITIDYRESENVKRVVFTRPKQNHLKNGDEPYLVHFLIEDFRKIFNHLVFTTNYKDVSGIKYQQRIFAEIDNFGRDITPGLPEIVTE